MQCDAVSLLRRRSQATLDLLLASGAFFRSWCFSPFGSRTRYPAPFVCRRARKRR